MGSDVRPRLPKSFNGLLAQLLSVRYPKGTAVETILSNGLDDRLYGDARLARSGRHTDHPAPLGAVHVPVAEHVPNLGDDFLLVVVEWGE